MLSLLKTNNLDWDLGVINRKENRAILVKILISNNKIGKPNLEEEEEEEEAKGENRSLNPSILLYFAGRYINTILFAF